MDICEETQLLPFTGTSLFLPFALAKMGYGKEFKGKIDFYKVRM